jgi:hypothetical protein
MGHVADGVDVDQAADPGDQQHEDDGQLVDEQTGADVPGADGDPVVQRHSYRAFRRVAAEELGEVADSDGEGGQRRDGAQKVAPPVAGLADQQQDRRADRRDGDEQPGQGEEPGGGYRHDDFEQRHHLSFRT